LAGKLEGKTPLGRHKHIWEDNIRMVLTEIIWEPVDWIHMAQDRDQWRDLVNTNEPWGSVKGGKFLEELSE
jgi:hypothetical protein